MHYTYILQSEQQPDRHYIGSTDNRDTLSLFNKAPKCRFLHYMRRDKKRDIAPCLSPLGGIDESQKCYECASSLAGRMSLMSALRSLARVRKSHSF